MGRKAMNIEEIKNTIRSIIHETAPEIEFEKIQMNLPLRDQVEIDSFDFYRMMVKVNQQTGVFIPDSEIARFSNLQDLMNYLNEHQKS